MLAGLVGFLVAAGLLLRGAWDPWAQCLILSAFAAGFALWLSARIAIGWIPLPSSLVARWSAALATLVAASAWLSPVPAYSRLAAAALLPGLLLFPLLETMSERERERADWAVRAAAWIMALLAVYQHFNGEARPPSTLLNQNAFAGAILLFLPVALRGGDWALSALLVLCLWWTKSVGAWLGLAAALVLSRRAVGTAGYWIGATAGFAGLVAVYAKLQSPETLHRAAWWGAASRMAADSPWLGLGTGAYAYALPAYLPERPELSSLFAHQHLLELAAENGMPFLLLWGAGLAWYLLPARPERRFGPLAALIHGLVDYPLSLPGVFWLFCRETAGTRPPTGGGLSVRSRWKLPAILAVLFVAGAGLGALDRIRLGHRLRGEAFVALRAGDLVSADAGLARSEAASPHPETSRMRAEIAAARAELDAAEEHLERAIALDPWRASNRSMLEAVRRRREAAGGGR